MRLSSIPQLRFALENDSEAAGKIATSLAPAATAASKPWKKERRPNDHDHSQILF